jgi:hypothetical protein
MSEKIQEQMEEFKTNDKSYSRSRYLKFIGATVGNKTTGEACNGDYNVAGDISRFKGGLLHGGVDLDGEPQAAIELLNGHTEWWEDGQPHRDNGPAVISLNGTWEEFWHHGELLLIRVYGSISITDKDGA